MLKELLIARLLGRFWSLCLYALAYGPWPRLMHQLIIRIYQKIFQIQWTDVSNFKNLGEFFLRPMNFQQAQSPLISPAESLILEGPSKIDLSQRVSIKGLEYSWKEFHEWHDDFEGAVFWNFYLSPPDYHWVHAPCDATELRGRRTPGLKIPVNAWGRKCFPKLYLQNDRLSLQWRHPELGRVWMILVGAMGVSSIRYEGPTVESDQWTSLPSFRRGERIGGFELGSSVLLVVQKPGKLFEGLKKVTPGMALVREIQ
jgi:phosphatidylserine decarboxylase precursor